MEDPKQKIAHLIKQARLAKNYTQLELAELAHLSLRSVQRIESGEVCPRAFTLRSLATALEFEIPPTDLRMEPSLIMDRRAFQNGKTGTSKFFVVVILLGICAVLFASAFLAQSPTFPETTFELLMFWAVVTCVYTYLVLRYIKVKIVHRFDLKIDKEVSE
ncbi:helix-turn-helix domain-containing protein [Pedobacter xixiisoli]|uniref:Helix-turn-helix n=1 Tax=Pedobacter xixiisoli TaxID=1476464 RepID=A0A285ZWA9_9SPHI|nr:helix-turn-helix transcriptional regulator [Pedobacter xixiisoli]SOD13928.1 Helix-turn-helix [Pedobacter xixiisoli]